MADLVVTIPAKITAVDTSEHELKFDASLFSQGPIELVIEVTTGTVTFSKGRPKSNQSAPYAAASNKMCFVTLDHGNQSLYYTANAVSDAFVICE
jgi:hypothetical protein